MSRLRYTPKFCDELIRRLQAGDDPQELRRELNVGSAAMTRFVCFAGQRVGK